MGSVVGGVVVSVRQDGVPVVGQGETGLVLRGTALYLGRGLFPFFIIS